MSFRRGWSGLLIAALCVVRRVVSDAALRAYWFTVRISLISEPSVVCHSSRGHWRDGQDCTALLEPSANQNLIEADWVLQFFRRELQAGVVA